MANLSRVDGVLGYFHARGIRNRWLRNSFLGAMIGVVAIALIVISVVGNYFYSAMMSGLETKAKTASDFFQSYATSGSEFRDMARYYISGFDEKDVLEVQFLEVNPEPRVYISSNALMSGARPKTNDILTAINEKELSGWRGRNPETGERIMSVSAPIVYDGEVKGVMRFITSLRPTDLQLTEFGFVIGAVALVFVILTYLLNMVFVRSIIQPMRNLTETAKRIAAGDYGIQLAKKYDDEIGDLTDAINDMSLRISQNEKMKSEFISSVSHELRTPLTAINGWGETLLSGKLDTREDKSKAMQIIVSESSRLTKMVEELLEFSRIEDGRFKLNLEPIDIQAEFEDAIYTYQSFFREQGIILNYSMPDQEFPLIKGDPERLRQVFTNLLDNAAKHGGAGKRIDTTIGEEDGYIAIVIRDFGPGVPEDELPHIKEKFYKGSSKARGNGIGLAVCDEIVTSHGGRLDIMNAEAGSGCVVTVLLPKEEK